MRNFKIAIIVFLITFVLVGCSVPRKLKIKSVTEYLDSQVEKHNDLWKYEAERVQSRVSIRFRFEENASEENKELITNEALEFFSNEDIQMEIREYYSKKYNGGKLHRGFPDLLLIFYSKDNVDPDYSYENHIEYRPTKNNGTQAIYGDWFGPTKEE